MNRIAVLVLVLLLASSGLLTAVVRESSLDGAPEFYSLIYD